MFSETTRDADTDDEWDRGDSRTTWYFGSVSLEKTGSWYDCFETSFDVQKGDMLYLVIAIWSTGNSFGHDDGASMEIFYASKDSSEAYRVANLLEKGKDQNGEPMTYIPWNGWFESLNEIRVHGAMVK